MSEYRAQLHALLSEKRMRLRERALRAQGVVVDLHMACSPHVPVEEIQGAAVEEAARTLRRLIDEIRSLSEEVRRIEADLGVGHD